MVAKRDEVFTRSQLLQLLRRESIAAVCQAEIEADRRLLHAVLALLLICW